MVISTSDKDINQKKEKAEERPTSLYDFTTESPETSDARKQQKSKTKAVKAKTESQNTKNVKPKKGTNKMKTGKGKVAQEAKTPKLPLQKQPVFQNCDSEKLVKGRRNWKNVKPLPPPNLDDISPIVSHQMQRIQSDTDTIFVTPKEGTRTRSLRSSLNKIVETPSASFLKPQTPKSDENDSGLFLSPRKTMPRFSEGKTSTPALSLPSKAVKKTKQKRTVRIVSKTETSTPVEVERKEPKTYTKVKSKMPEISPVQRTETPTSDYCSMESIVTPSPTPVKQKGKKRASSPAFTLEDDTGEK